MCRLKLHVLAMLFGIGAMLFAGPLLAQDPVPPEDPPGTASGTGTQFVVSYGDSVHFTVTTTDSVEAVIHAFSTTSLDITLVGVGGVTSTQVTIAGFAPEVTLHIAVDDLRNDVLFTADAGGVHSFTQDLTAPRHVMIKPHPSTWYLGDNGWTAHQEAASLLIWGTAGTGDGQFTYPLGVAIDASGYVYVTDYGAHRVQKFDANGNFVRTWGSYGTGDGEFNGPRSVDVSIDGYVYVVDLGNHRIQQFTADGGFVRKWGSYGSGDSQFKNPTGMAIDADGFVYVSDKDNHRIQKFNANGDYVAKWGSYGTGNGQLRFPYGLTVDSDRNVYVADNNTVRIQKFTSTGTYVAKWGSSGTGNGQFGGVWDVAVDGAGYVYVSDPGNHCIHQFTSNGVFVARWGTRGAGVGQLDGPRDLAFDAAGNVYVAEISNSRIQKFDPSNIIEVLPGTWDPVTKTATLTQDVTETIQISGTDITLDGAGHSVTAPGTYGVYVNGGANITVQNLTASGTYGVHVYSGTRHTVRNLAAQGSNYGVYVSGGWGHSLRNLTASGLFGIYIRSGSACLVEGSNATGSTSNAYDGIGLEATSDCTVHNNVSSARYGIMLHSGTTRSVIKGNTAWGSYYGLYLYSTSRATVARNSFTGTTRATNITYGGSHTIYQNNFVSETGGPPALNASSNNVFSLPAPVGGNYWNTWCPPAHPDNNADRFVDEPYTLASGNVDHLPYAQPDGWVMPPPGASDLPAGLVAWWPGDGDALDRVGIYHGTTSGGVGFSPGKLGQAFDLSSGSVTFGLMAEYFGTSDFTADWWMKTTQVADNVISILGKRGDNCWGEGFSIDVGMNPSGELIYGVWQSPFFNPLTTPTGLRLNDGIWHHVAIVREGATKILYVDGTAVAAGADPVVVNVSNKAPFYLSDSPCIPYGLKRLVGQIDELHFFGRALSSAEVRILAGSLLEISAPVAASYACAAAVPAASPEQATVTGGQGTPTVTVSETSNEGAGTEMSPLILTRTWTATDEGGRTASDTQTITVVDAVAPALTVPAAVSVTAGPGVESCGEVRRAVEYGQATATDNCGEPTVTVGGVPEGGFPVGTTTLTWTATDAVGNVASGEQTVTVTCPVGTLAGLANQTCDGLTSPSAAAAVSLLHEGTPFRNTATGADGGYAFTDVRLGTYTVEIVPPEGYGVPIGTQTVTLAGDLLEVEPFAFTCLLGDIAGTVEGSCNGMTAGLHGVTMDVYRQNDQGLDVLVATAATDATGSFRFNNLALGEYSLSPVKPLGYSAASSAMTVSLTVPDGLVQTPAFALACQPIVNQVRGMGYWKHQVNVYLTGKGSAQETLADLLGYIDLMVEHFNQNLVNPVIVYVPGSSNTNDRLLQLQQLLTVNKGGTALDRAKQHLLPLLLNVVSAKISQTEVISDNGATVSQAITHCHDLIVDGIASNDATAQTIAERINEGQRVPSGMVPISTRQITYDPKPVAEETYALRLERISPNPAQGAFTLAFSLTGNGVASLEVVDVAGRQVLRRDVGWLGAGRHSLGSGELGSLAPGLYFVRLSEAGSTVIGRVAVVP